MSSTPEFFQRGPSPLVRLVFFCALSLAFMVVDARYHGARMVRSTLTTLIYPLQQAALLPVRLADSVGDFFSTQRRLQADNDDLRRHAVDLASKANRVTSLEQELAELRELTHLPGRPQETTVLTEVLHGGRNPYIAKLVLNRGETSGLHAGQPVVDAAGVVGQVTSTSAFSAEVTLITEQNQQVPVRVLRNGLRTLTGGDGAAGTISLPFLPGGADIQTGDVLVTSGIDGLYPEGIPVATVTRIESSASRVFARITCTPVAGVARARYLLVITSPPANVPIVPPGPPGSASASGAAAAPTLPAPAAPGATPAAPTPPAATPPAAAAHAQGTGTAAGRRPR